MSRSRKYQIPHYDRVRRETRNAVAWGHSLLQTLGPNVVRETIDPMESFFVAQSAMILSSPEFNRLPYAEQGRLLRAHMETWDQPKRLPGDYDFTVSEIHACYEYNRYNRQVFSLSPIMQEMFANTDLKDVTRDDLKLPFPCFYMQLEPGSQEPLMMPMLEEEDGWSSRGGVSDGDFTMDGNTTGRLDKVGQRTVPLSGVYVNMYSGGDVPMDVLSLTAIGWPENETDYAKFFFEIPIDVLFEKGIEEGINSLFGASEHPDGERLHELTVSIIRQLIALLFYLNSDDRSVIEYTERPEQQAIEDALRRSRKRNSPRNRKRKERLKYYSTANYHHVGVAVEEQVTSQPGFDITKPRIWRRGHMHRYWTGPRKIDGVFIPFEEWPDKRKLIKKWTIPTLINPEGERIERTNRFVSSDFLEIQRRVFEAVGYREGAAVEVTQTRHERNSEARTACLEHYGTSCVVCGWSALKHAGETFTGTIHVHHLDPLGDAVEERMVDPVEDMRPVCANCHGCIHRRKPMYTIEEMVEFRAEAVRDMNAAAK